MRKITREECVVLVALLIMGPVGASLVIHESKAVPAAPAVKPPCKEKVISTYTHDLDGEHPRCAGHLESLYGEIGLKIRCVCDE